MKVLIVTNMYPNKKEPNAGIFIKEQIEAIKKEGIEIEVIFINGKLCKLNYIKGMITVLMKSITNKYDIIHAHYGLSGIAACCQWRYPVIITFHGSDLNLGWQRLISKIISQYTKKAIVVSDKLKDKIKNSIIIPCGVNFEKIKPISKTLAREKLSLKINKNYIIFSGTPEDKIKRYDIYIKVMDILKNKNINVEPLILKNIPHNDMYLYYSAADVMLLTSDMEGSPTMVKEALACNLPIVSRDVGDVKKLIKNIPGCYIVQDNPNDIAEKVIEIIKKNKKINTREKVKYLSVENIAKQIISIYKEVAK